VQHALDDGSSRIEAADGQFEILVPAFVLKYLELAFEDDTRIGTGVASFQA